jgi:single-strand DNA-binding protein
MPYLSSITIMGHAGKPAECRTVGETTCTTVSVAVNTRYKEKSGEWADRTTWWRVSVWGKQGEWIARECIKGSIVVASGEAEVREWKKEDGSSGWAAEIRAHNCRIVSSKQETASHQEQTATAKVARATASAGVESTNEDVPF